MLRRMGNNIRFAISFSGYPNIFSKKKKKKKKKKKPMIVEMCFGGERESGPFFSFFQHSFEVDIPRKWCFFFTIFFVIPTKLALKEK